MHYTNAHLKVIALYCLFAMVMLATVWLVYDNTKTLIAANRQNATFAQRRSMADSLVYSLLEVNNAERSLCLGVISEWQTFDESLKRASALAETLKVNTTEPQQAARIDSLISLISRKRIDMNRILAFMDASHSDGFLRKKVKDFQTGRDSVIIHPQVRNTTENSETVYEVVKTRRTFFARLADAFRRQRTDTLATTKRQQQAVADSLEANIDIADTVADLLAKIKHEETSQRLAHQQDINSSNRRLQLLSVETATKTEQLLKDISSDERLALQTATATSNHERRLLILKIMALAAVAIASALVLMLLVWRDIHRQTAYSKRLEQANAETKRLMNQRERLLLTITHDIKAPAASISGFTELLDEYIKNEKGRSFLSNIRSSATHLLSLVSALLDYHSLEQGRIKPQPVSFSLRQLVESSVAERRPQASDKGIAIKCNVVSDTMLRADAFRIKQILDNLIGNAIKFTDEGKVCVSATLNGDKLQIEVDDTGCGMDEEELKVVFNAFTRLPSAQGTDGVGLGLAIVRSVANLLNGKVTVKSQKGEGSMFTVCIPVEKESKRAIGYLEEQARETVTSTTAIINLLIVDDDKLQLTLLNEMFARLSPQVFNIKTATCAKQALRAVAEEKSELMLIDIEMPDMNGTELLKNIEKSIYDSRPQDPTTVKYIAMTAHESDIEPQLKAAGFTASLFKPFSIMQLRNVLSAVTGIELSFAEKNMDAQKPLQADFTSLTSFAEGDKAVERQILSDFRSSLIEAKEELRKSSETISSIDRLTISRTAHRLFPTLKMVNARTAEILPQLTTANIASLSDKTVAEMVSKIMDEIDELSSALTKRCSE